jgi:hypothetical protein
VDGRVTGWTGLKTTGDWVAAGKTNVLVQIGLRKISELPSKPLLPELATNDKEREVLEFLSVGPAMGRPFFMPPGTPAERAAAIRHAFDATMKDSGFLEEIKRSKIEVAPVSGDALQRIVLRTFDVSPEVLATAKTAME